jgi:Mlc titration factor MtfA (ptsG expression regulator)
LRKITGLFISDKHFSAAAQFELTEKMVVQIAAQACLLILNRSIDDYDGCQEIIVYPDTFIAEQQYVDEAGVMHSYSRPLEGEAWDNGPVIIAWSDADPSRQDERHPAANVVLHEFAHKLDMLNGVANGMPVLNRDMKREDWTQVFTRAYDRLLRQIANGDVVSIDPYAAHSPAEFFAVVSEYFFMAPDLLHRHFPGVYKELVAYYGQNPLAMDAAQTGVIQHRA